MRLHFVFLVLLFSVLLLPSVSFAQSDDVGEILFRDVLQLRDYPGGPFSGRTITENLIMFFLVPTVFIILVVYMMVGRIFPPEAPYGKLKLLLGVTAYLFIIAGGYYGTFALLAGPYFIFLIFIMGLLYFLLGHFRGGGGGGPGGGERHGSSAGAEAAGMGSGDKLKYLLGLRKINPADRKWMESEARTLWHAARRAEKIGMKGGRVQYDPVEVRLRLDGIERALYAKVLHDDERNRKYGKN